MAEAAPNIGEGVGHGRANPKETADKYWKKVNFDYAPYLEKYEQARKDFDNMPNDRNGYKWMTHQAYDKLVHITDVKSAEGQILLFDSLILLTRVLKPVPDLYGPAQKQDYCWMLQWFVGYVYERMDTAWPCWWLTDSFATVFFSDSMVHAVPALRRIAWKSLLPEAAAMTMAKEAGLPCREELRAGTKVQLAAGRAWWRWQATQATELAPTETGESLDGDLSVEEWDEMYSEDELYPDASSNCPSSAHEPSSSGCGSPVSPSGCSAPGYAGYAGAPSVYGRHAALHMPAAPRASGVRSGDLEGGGGDRRGREEQKGAEQGLHLADPKSGVDALGECKDMGSAPDQALGAAEQEGEDGKGEDSAMVDEQQQTAAEKDEALANMRMRLQEMDKELQRQAAEIRQLKEEMAKLRGGSRKGQGFFAQCCMRC